MEASPRRRPARPIRSRVPRPGLRHRGRRPATRGTLSRRAIHGLDLTPGMIEIARRRDRSGRVTFSVGDMSRLDFPDASLDVITGSYAIRNAPDLGGTLDEIARVLRRGDGRSFSISQSHRERPPRPSNTTSSASGGILGSRPARQSPHPRLHLLEPARLSRRSLARRRSRAPRLRRSCLAPPLLRNDAAARAPTNFLTNPLKPPA